MTSLPGWMRLTGPFVIAAGRHCVAAPRTVDVDVLVLVSVIVTTAVYTSWSASTASAWYLENDSLKRGQSL